MFVVVYWTVICLGVGVGAIRCCVVVCFVLLFIGCFEVGLVVCIFSQ